MVEYHLRKVEVSGSSPLPASKFKLNNMGFFNIIPSITAARMLREQGQHSGREGRHSSPPQLLTKEESLKAIEEGKCQMCGEPEGEEKAICDNCRWM